MSEVRVLCVSHVPLTDLKVRGDLVSAGQQSSERKGTFVGLVAADHCFYAAGHVESGDIASPTAFPTRPCATPANLPGWRLEAVLVQ